MAKMTKNEKIILLGVGAVAAYFIYQEWITGGASFLPGSPATAEEEAQSAATTLSNNLATV